MGVEYVGQVKGGNWSCVAVSRVDSGEGKCNGQFF